MARHGYAISCGTENITKETKSIWKEASSLGEKLEENAAESRVFNCGFVAGGSKGVALAEGTEGTAEGLTDRNLGWGELTHGKQSKSSYCELVRWLDW